MSFLYPVSSLGALTTGIVIGFSNGAIRLMDSSYSSTSLFKNSPNNGVIFLTQLQTNNLFLSSASDNNQNIRIWDITILDYTSSVTVTGKGTCGTLLTNGLMAIGMSSDKSVALWNVTNLAIAKTMIGHTNTIFGITQLQNGLLASG